ncbi:MAG: hypothetical protein LBE97_00185 [Holosporales bacterium]|jgi:DNA-directed RNA polymerase beta' subunit|nr:hypothetical protein [Holosporales bacterium]
MHNIQKNIKPEFSRPIKISSDILDKNFKIYANEQELNQLAKRFELHQIKNLSLQYIIMHKLDIIGAYILMAEINALVTKFVIKTSEENLKINEKFDVVFLTEKQAKENEKQLTEFDIEILSDDNIIDIGEIASQYLSLCVFM